MRILSWLGTPLLVSMGVVLALTGATLAECGKASWYGAEMCRPGKRCLTANGENFDPNGLTIALRRKPEKPPARYRVTYGSRSVVVRHTDYGPHARTGRLADLSRGAAAKIGMIKVGVGLVCISRVKG